MWDKIPRRGALDNQEKMKWSNQNKRNKKIHNLNIWAIMKNMHTERQGLIHPKQGDIRGMPYDADQLSEWGSKINSDQGGTLLKNNSILWMQWIA